MPRKSFSSVSSLNIKPITLPTLGMAIGIYVGGYFGEKPPVIYDVGEETQIQVCFTPKNQCLPLILKEIQAAKHEILIQTYYLTSQPIAEALIQASQRSVIVKLLADKTQENHGRSQIWALKKAGISVLIDSKPHIAHNKVIIIDTDIVIGGSYNHAQAAETSNAENVLIIKNSKIAQEYRQNWFERSILSRPLTPKSLKKL